MRSPVSRGRPTALLLLLLLLATLSSCGEEVPSEDKDAGLVDAADSHFAGDDSDAADSESPDAEAPDTEAADTAAPPEDGAQSTDVAWPGDGACTPNCQGKVCGPDGCGSVCGFCATGTFCAKDGSKCEEFCKPVCEGKACGDNGCGGNCGECGAGKHCGIDFLCYADDCVAACGAKVCGDDGCGKACGSCASGDVCDSAGQCKPSPCKGIPKEGACDGDILLQCEGEGAAAAKKQKDCGAQLPVGAKVCGWDPLASAYGCIDKPPCEPKCSAVSGAAFECGDDGCGGSCGKCLDGWACEQGQCKVKAGGACGGTFNSKTGACDGNTWLLCSAGKIAAVDCGKAGKSCQWTGSAYGCK